MGNKFNFLAAFTADTGDHGDTGVAWCGTVKSIQWNPTTADTGGAVSLARVPADGDTGEGHVFYTSPAAALGGDFVKHADTGALSKLIFGWQDKLRVRYSNTTTLAGRLRVWTEKD